MQPEFDVIWNGAVRPEEPFVREHAREPQPTTPVLLGRSIRLTKICGMCGEPFSVKVSEAHRRRFCSWQCRKREITKACPHCHEDFTVSGKYQRRVFCSQACQSAAESARRTGKMTAIGRKGGLKSAAVRRELAERQRLDA